MEKIMTKYIADYGDVERGRLADLAIKYCIAFKWTGEALSDTALQHYSITDVIIFIPYRRGVGV
jgi:hypothetical protein